MRVVINGEEREVPEGCTVRELLEWLGIRTELVAVEVNRNVVSREEHATCSVSPGDHIEIVSFTGGG